MNQVYLSALMRASVLASAHVGDTCCPLSPDDAGPRLASVGFEDIVIESRSRFFRFCARFPLVTDVEPEWRP